MLSLMERICLEWLRDRFGCTEQEFERLSSLDNRIERVQRAVKKLKARLARGRRRARGEKSAIETTSRRDFPVIGIPSIVEEEEEKGESEIGGRPQPSGFG